MTYQALTWLNPKYIPYHSVCDYTQEYKEKRLEFYNNKPTGLYMFCVKDMFSDIDHVKYIGMSTNLHERICSSLMGKLKYFKLCLSQLYLSYIIFDSLSDANLAEIYYISKYKPDLNKQFKNGGCLNLRISNIPEFSEPIKIFNIPEISMESIPEELYQHFMSI